jgi:protein-tyrosine-phosphatase
VDEAVPEWPRSVLFACGQNSIRSPMAAALARRVLPSMRIASAGVRKGDLDPFAVAVMAEVGLDIAEHEPVTFEDVEDLDGFEFDLIITLAPEAHHKALALTHRIATVVEYWPTADPSDVEGNRTQRLDAYRAVREQLAARIAARFAASADHHKT